MFLERLKVCNFRNHDDIEIDLKPGVNLLIGPNASGKTSILESINFSATQRSHRTNNQEDLIKKDREFSIINCRVKDNIVFDYEIVMERDKGRRLRIDHQEVKRGQKKRTPAVVIMSPDDHLLIKGEPSRRRAYIDGIIGQTVQKYRQLLLGYRRVVWQRNILLKRIRNNEATINELAPWSEKLIEYGVLIVKNRNEIIEKLNELIYEKINAPLRYKRRLTLEYESACGASHEEFEHNINKMKELEIQKRQTLVGPHRDDIRILLDGDDSRQHASQGEQKMALMILKQAEVEYIRSALDSYPIFLIDDAFSELDEMHQAGIIDLVSTVEQSIITATQSIKHSEDWNIISIK